MAQPQQPDLESIRPHRLVWFEIPAADFDRAVLFYETLLDVKLRQAPVGGPQPGIGGMVGYLNAEPSLDTVLARVAEAGGHVVIPRTELPPGMGAFARIRDTEGNLVGLHALA